MDLVCQSIKEKCTADLEGIEPLNDGMIHPKECVEYWSIQISKTSIRNRKLIKRCI
jgi:hypothetical protein